MNIFEATKIISDYLKNAKGDPSYNLDLSSQQAHLEEPVHWFRADIGYLISGDWEYTIEEALIALARRIKG